MTRGELGSSDTRTASHEPNPPEQNVLSAENSRSSSTMAPIGAAIHPFFQNDRSRNKIQNHLDRSRRSDGHETDLPPSSNLNIRIKREHKRGANDHKGSKFKNLVANTSKQEFKRTQFSTSPACPRQADQRPN